MNEIDNRGSHFFLALYWAQALAKQEKDKELQVHFAEMASELETNSKKIQEELIQAQGSAVDLGGYYFPDQDKASAAMRPSATFNAIMN